MDHELSAVIQEILKFANIAVWPWSILYFIERYEKQIGEFLKQVTKITIKDVTLERPGQNAVEANPLLDAIEKPKEIATNAVNPEIVSGNQEYVPVADGLKVSVDYEDDKLFGPTYKPFIELLDELVENEPDKAGLMRYMLIRMSYKYKLYQAYANIFGSQITLLEQLNTKPNGMSNSSVAEFYLKHENGTTSELESWLKFLIQSGFVTLESDKVSITDFGVEFLAFLVTDKLNKNKQF